MSECLACTRREFLAAGTVAAVGVFLAACGGDGESATGPSKVNLTVTLASFPALGAVGGIARVTTSGTPIAVVRATASSYRAFSMACPHQGTTISISGTGFRCPNHGATFNGNGAWTGGERTSGLFEFTVASNTTAGTITITS
jgi:nitrite reductase/ring-hydroxylating ferredoxin subunit